jgi:curved DNA-binding protein
LEYKDYYGILGVSKDASKEEIQRAYRKLARKLHPDINREAGSEERFKEVTEAYEVLKDPEKRAKYDQFGHAWKQAQQTGAPPPGWEHVNINFGPGSVTFEDLGQGFGSFFEMLFGQPPPSGFPGFEEGAFGAARRPTGATGRQRHGTWPRARGADMEVKVRLSLEDASRGVERTLTLKDPATGETQTFRTRIPAGVRPGRRVRIAGKGGAGPQGAPRGDLYLDIELIPHPRFRLDGHNLRTRVPVTPWEAALGGQARIHTLDGPVTVRIPPGSPSGRQIRLEGKGFPKGNGTRGDLLAELEVVVPTELSPRERELLEELAKVSEFDPRRERLRQ